MEIRRAATMLRLEPDRLERERVVAAWRRFARDNHPDRCPGDPSAVDRFHAGRAAYEALLAAVPPPPRAVAPDADPPRGREWRA